MRMTNKSLMFRLRARVECMLIYKSENMWLQTPTVDTYIYVGFCWSTLHYYHEWRRVKIY